jgi:hypothetical protein
MDSAGNKVVTSPRCKKININVDAVSMLLSVSVTMRSMMRGGHPITYPSADRGVQKDSVIAMLLPVGKLRKLSLYSIHHIHLYSLYVHCADRVRL